jgi:hypothetical protein
MWVTKKTHKSSAGHADLERHRARTDIGQVEQRALNAAFGFEML